MKCNVVLVCYVCEKNATLIADRPGGYNACDDHLEKIAAFNAVSKRVQQIRYQYGDDSHIPASLLERLTDLRLELLAMRT